MNPVKITLLTLGALVTLTILFMFIIDDVSEKPFAIAVYSFYLALFVCTIAFIISSFFYQSWINNNKVGVAIFSTILIVWTICIIFYIRSSFI